MKVLITYKYDAGQELRFAIRSMVKHFRDLTGVLLIGDKPQWYTGEHIPAKDTPGRKAYSIYSKIILCKEPRFLWCANDHFATQDFNETLPLYYTGPLATAKAGGNHLERFKRTEALIPGGLSYDLHVPLVIDREKFIKACDVDWTKEYLWRSLYGNYIGGGVQMEDCKIRHGSKIPPGPFFSTNDRTAMLINFAELYPNASPYEK